MTILVALLVWVALSFVAGAVWSVFGWYAGPAWWFREPTGLAADLALDAPPTSAVRVA